MLIAAVILNITPACVDRDFKIEEVSTEVTLLTAKTKIRIGTLENKTLGELLGDTEIEGLERGEDGSYSFGYASEGDPISIEGVTTSFEIPGTEDSFQVNFPSLELNTDLEFKINETGKFELNTESLEKYMQEGDDEYTIPYLEVDYPKFSGEFTKKLDYEEAHLHFDVPEQIDNVHKIYFKDIENGHHGAPMHITVYFNDIAGINGGGKVWFTLKQSGGKFTLLDKDNNQIFYGEEYNVEYDVNKGDKSMDFVVYVESVTNEHALNQDHSLDVDLSMTCDLKFEIESQPGTFSLKNHPTIALNADFEFGDADVVLNNNVDVINYDGGKGFNIEIDSIPEQIKQIERISLKPDTNLRLFAQGFEWLDEDCAEAVEVVVTLPDYLVLHGLSDVEYEYDSGLHQITTNVAAISRGFDIGLDALDFGAKGLCPDSGKISLNFAPKIRAHFNSEKDVLVSKLIPESEQMEILTGIEQCRVELESLCGVIDYKYQIEQSFNIKTDDLDIGDIEIDGVGLSPVLTINLINPLTVPLKVDGTLSDNSSREFTISGVVLEAAEYVNGEIVPAYNKIVIARERPEYDCIFVEVDFDELLAGTIPSELSVQLSIGVDASQSHTLHVAEAFEIEYDYKVELPIALNDKLKVRYADEVSGLGEIFTQLAEYDIHVGDVVVVAEVENTTPLAFAADVRMLDSEGSEVNVALSFVDGYDCVKGSSDGQTVATSTLRINVSNDDRGGLDVSSLADIDAIAFELTASSSAEGDVDINEKQHVAVKLWLEISGGITLDLKDFIKEESNE